MGNPKLKTHTGGTNWKINLFLGIVVMILIVSVIFTSGRRGIGVSTIKPSPTSSPSARPLLNLCQIPPTSTNLYFPDENVVYFLTTSLNSGVNKLVRVETATHTTSPVEAFNIRFGRELMGFKSVEYAIKDAGSSTSYSFKEGSFSPDGKHLLWLSPSGGWVAAALDGSSFNKWRVPLNTPSLSVWAPDGRHWIELIADCSSGSCRLTDAVVYDVRSPSKLKVRSFQSIKDGYLLGITSEWFALVLDDLIPTRQVSRVTLSLVPIRTGQAHTLTVSLPQTASVHDVKVSPNGRKLGWLCEVPKQNASRKTIYQIWESDIDGRSSIVVGELDGIQEEVIPYALRWLPDTKRLSCIVGSNLMITQLPRK